MQARHRQGCSHWTHAGWRPSSSRTPVSLLLFWTVPACPRQAAFPTTVAQRACMYNTLRPELLTATPEPFVDPHRDA